jgi:hypothetical protein
LVIAFWLNLEPPDALSQGRTRIGSIPVVNVIEYGARGDGRTLNTTAIQAAIDAAAKRGGGTVYVPNGTFLSGTLVLKSNIVLYLETGATLLGSASLSDYVFLQSRPERIAAISNKTKAEDYGSLHLLYAGGARNITIAGSGTIDGNGRSFWDDNFAPRVRPNQMIQFEDCEDIRVENIRIRNSPFWALHVLSSKRIRIDGVTILNDRRGPNTDGIDINSSSDVSITNCFIDTGDDAICFKSLFEDEPVTNVTVANCVLSSDDSALKLGTRSFGIIQNITVMNCVIRQSTYGISLFMKDGGTYQDLRFSNLTIETSMHEGRTRAVYPIFVDVERRGPDSKLGRVKNISFSQISITTTGHSLISGSPESPVEGIYFNDVRVRLPQMDQMRNQSKPRGVSGLSRPELDFASVPSLFTFAYVRGLHVRNLSIAVEHTDAKVAKHALWMTSGLDVEINGFAVSALFFSESRSVLEFVDTKNVFITNARAYEGTQSFLRLRGAATRNITVIGNDFSAARMPFDLSQEVVRDEFYQSANKLP